MKARIIAAVVLAVALAVAASTAAGSTRKAAASEVVVWVMTDAQKGWPDAVAGPTARSTAAPRRPTSKSSTRAGTASAKFDAAIAAGDAPDVIELGNTETTKYMAAGLLPPSRPRATTRTPGTWLRGPQGPCPLRRQDLLRAVLRGRPGADLPHGPVRGRRQETPSTYDEWSTATKAEKTNGKDKNFSAFYMPGSTGTPRCRSSTTGGEIATSRTGKWSAVLESPKAVQGLTASSRWCRSSRGPHDEGRSAADPAHLRPRATPDRSTATAGSWARCDPKPDPRTRSRQAVGDYPLPRHIKGKGMPTFLGGSDLA